MKFKYSPQVREEAFLMLYDSGWADGRIAAAMNAHPRTIKNWRDARGLINRCGPRASCIDKMRARELYDSGQSDGAIAKAFGVTQSSATRWRQRQGLPANICSRTPAPEIKRQIVKSLQAGASATQAAKLAGVSKTTALKYREKAKPAFLRTIGMTNRNIRARVLSDPTLHSRIASAIGNALPPEIQEDACSDLYLAVLSGEVAVDLIEDQAAHYRNLAWKMAGSSFEQRSIFEEIGEGICLGDTLEDAHALQDMEEAAERAFAVH